MTAGRLRLPVGCWLHKNRKGVCHHQHFQPLPPHAFRILSYLVDHHRSGDYDFYRAYRWMARRSRPLSRRSLRKNSSDSPVTVLSSPTLYRENARTESLSAEKEGRFGP